MSLPNCAKDGGVLAIWEGRNLLRPVPYRPLRSQQAATLPREGRNLLRPLPYRPLRSQQAATLPVGLFRWRSSRYLKITIVPSAETVRTHEVAVTVTRGLRPFGSSTDGSNVADASAVAEAESMDV